jgi:hypothetical protein
MYLAVLSTKPIAEQKAIVRKTWANISVAVNSSAFIDMNPHTDSYVVNIVRFSTSTAPRNLDTSKPTLDFLFFIPNSLGANWKTDALYFIG